MVVVEPIVNEEKLRQLLAEECESEQLDYKRVLDLAETRDRVELAKDVGAMLMLGGYIVVGADDNGRVTGELTASQAPKLDESKVRAALTKSLPESIELLSARHLIDGNEVVLIYVGPHPDCLAVFKADGNYPVNDKVVTVFRKGEVFARHGTASERWQQGDIDRVRDCIEAKAKERWRREMLDPLLDSIRRGEAAKTLASASAASFSWRLDAETFRGIAVELLRSDDDVPIRLLMRGVTADARHMSDGEHVDELDTLLNRVACLGALATILSKEWLVDEVIDSLGRIYEVGFRLQDAPAGSAARLWLNILLRVYALGSLAVREEQWTTVRKLALREPGDPSDRQRFYRSWLRHGLTMAARSRLFTRTKDDREIELSLLSLANELVRDDACLRPDVAGDDEAVLDSLCQFDMLGVLAAIAEAKSLSKSNFYTSFARFYSHRTEPIVAELIKDPALRNAVVPLTDQQLADVLRAVNEIASRESFRYAGWEGFYDPVIETFLTTHPASDAGLGWERD